jgi:RNA polymerase sigma factor (sigma-70 family)
MPATRAGALLSHLHRLVDSQHSDAQLLQRFVTQRDETAFATLLDRHGRLVWSVCRHILHREHDAEDAFQAAFLVLARRAAAIRKGESLACWLHGVAYRIAVRAKQMTAKRQARERRAAAALAVPPPDFAARELQALLDEEVAQLPDKLRAPFVLCCLEGRSRTETAAELGWKVGTVSSRIAQARQRLQAGLARRGVTLSAALTAGVLWNQPASAALVQATQQAALRIAAGQTVSQVVGPTVTALAADVLKAATWTKTRIAALLLMIASVFGGLATAVAHRPGQKTEQATQQRKATSDEPGADQYGDPLPQGAIARMGTIRLRHAGHAFAVAFLADGNTVVSGGADGTLNAWEVATGKRIKHQKLAASTHSIAIAPDGKTAALGDSHGEGIRLIDTASFQQIRFWKAHTGSDIWVDFAPDGRSLLSGAGDDAEIILWDPATGERLRSWQAHKGGARAPRFSPDGKTIASTGNADNGLALWDAATGKELWRQTVADLNPYVFCFAPDGKTLFVRGSGDHHVSVWDAATGKLVRRFESSRDGGGVLALTPSGKMLAAAGVWGRCQLWDVASGKPLRRLENCREDIRALAFSPDGKTLAAGCRDHIVRLWDTATGKERHRFASHDFFLTSVVFTLDGTGLLTGSFDGTVRQWEADTGRHVQELGRVNEYVWPLALSPDGRTLAVGTSANITKQWAPDAIHAVRLWDLKSGRALEPLRGFEGSVHSVAYSPDGKLLATRNENGPVRIWDTATWKECTRVDEFKEQKGSSEVVFSPDSRWIATSKSNTEVGIWDVATGRQVRKLVGALKNISSLVFTPDGRMLIASSYTDPIRLWEIATGKVRLEFGSDGKESIPAIALSPDGRTLASLSYNHPIRLWNVATGEKLAELDSPSRGINALAFSRDGRRLASGESDSTAMVWDVAAVTRRAKSQAAVADAQLDALWHDLIGNDAAKAFRALAKLAATPAQTVPLLQKNLNAKPDVDAKRIQHWLADLDSDQFAVREQAMKSLETVGDLAEPALRKALENPPSAEVRRRIEKLLARRNEQGLSGEPLQAVRAIELLEHIGTPEARELLGKLAASAAEARLTREAKAALERLGQH